MGVLSSTLATRREPELELRSVVAKGLGRVRADGRALVVCQVQRAHEGVKGLGAGQGAY